LSADCGDLSHKEQMFRGKQVPGERRSLGIQDQLQRLLAWMGAWVMASVLWVCCVFLCWSVRLIYMDYARDGIYPGGASWLFAVGQHPAVAAVTGTTLLGAVCLLFGRWIRSTAKATTFVAIFTPALHNPPHSGGASLGLKRL